MKFKRININSCCGKMSIILQIDQPLTKEHMHFLVGKGFKETPVFTAAGLMYVDNSDFILNGPFGSNRLTVKCKQNEAECNQKLNDLEGLLQQMG